MKKNQIAILVFGSMDSERNALTEEKYKFLADEFLLQGFEVCSVLYNDESAERLSSELLKFDAVLVWVNPVEQGNDRKILDSLLTEISGKGCFVSTHPEVIMKIGTKDVLYKTRDMEWGSDIRIFKNYQEFTGSFLKSLTKSGIRILKQHRGNGGNGVFKIIYDSSENDITVIHAKAGNEKKKFPIDNFYNEFKPFFSENGILIDQEWNNNIYNGMVRCYVSGKRVGGFGYQEINALYQAKENSGSAYIPPGKRFYFSENCGLFEDLKEVMENRWISQLLESQSITDYMMPVIWDADFFINKVNSSNAAEKYTLCEINVSCVSPFPPSAVKFIVAEVRKRLIK